MKIYDKKKIGKCLSWGSDHTVYEYGEGHVIKFSTSDFLLGSRKKTMDDYATCVSFFGPYILKTDFFVSPRGVFFASVQPEIEGRYLRATDLKRSVILEQYRELIGAYENMKRSHGSEIDFVGSGGILHTCLSNIFVTQDEKLVVIDSSLLELRGHNFNIIKLIFLLIIRPIALARQHSTIKIFNAFLA